MEDSNMEKFVEELKEKVFTDVEDITPYVNKFKEMLAEKSSPSHFLEVLADVVEEPAFTEIIRNADAFQACKDARAEYLSAISTDIGQVPDEFWTDSAVDAEVNKIRADFYMNRELVNKRTVFILSAIKNIALMSAISDIEEVVNEIKDKVIRANMISLGISDEHIDTMNLRNFPLREELFEKFQKFIDDIINVNNTGEDIQSRMNMIATDIDQRRHGANSNYFK